MQPGMQPGMEGAYDQNAAYAQQQQQQGYDPSMQGYDPSQQGYAQPGPGYQQGQQGWDQGAYPQQQVAYMQPGMMQPGMMQPGQPGQPGMPLMKKKKEKVPKHGQLSWTILIFGSFCLCFSLAVAFVPMIRTNRMGVPAYPYYRGMGFFAVYGRKKQSWYGFADKACESFGQLKLGNICISPLCRYYLLKCDVYYQMMYVSYLCGVIWIMGLIMHIGALFCTATLNPRKLRWARNSWPIASGLYIFSMVFWAFYTEDLLERLNTESIYPDQDLSMSFIMGLVCCVGTGVFLIFGMTLKKMWPEPEEDFSDTDESSEDSSSEDESSSASDAAKKGKKGGKVGKKKS